MTKIRSTEMAGVVADAQRVCLGDKRLTKRFTSIVRSFASCPGISIPRAMKDEAGREGMYRLLNNDSVTADKLLAPHFASTAERCRDSKTVLIASDTTEFIFGGERQGFFAHVALALEPDSRRPLGLLGFEAFRRDGRKSAQTAAQRRSAADNESLRWARVALRAGEAVSQCRVVHVMDREADIYSLAAKLAAAGQYFVIRVAQNRRLAGEEADVTTHVLDALAVTKMTCTRPVRLSKRGAAKKTTPPANRRTHPRRAERKATLGFGATTLEVRAPRDRTGAELPRTLKLNYVVVREQDCPADQPPVEWLLVTNLPVGTPAEMEAVIDAYRARWVIEEYFKALKSGCSYERCQLENYEAQLNFLATQAPIAWQLLALRSVARDSPDAPASDVLTATQLEVLRIFAPRPLPKDCSAGHAMAAIATLGGHIKNNGAPGWSSLWAGFEYLLNLERGFVAAKRSEQS